MGDVKTNSKTELNEKPSLRQNSQLRTGLTGLEPATSAVTGRCSNQLNYSPSIGNFVIMPILFRLVKSFGSSFFWWINSNPKSSKQML
jgi:hypothetical protein